MKLWEALCIGLGCSVAAVGCGAPVGDEETGAVGEAMVSKQATPPTLYGHFGGTMSLLPGGNVLLAGDLSDGRAEIFTPGAGITGFWTATSNLYPRALHTATTLANGNVVFIGGTIPGSTGVPQAGVDIYNPTTGTWTAAASSPHPGSRASAVLLGNGSVMVIDGDYSTFDWSVMKYVRPTCVFNPTFNAWTCGQPWLTSGRDDNTSFVLPTGQVMVVGGCDGNTGAQGTSLVSPISGSYFVNGPAMLNGRCLHTMTKLQNGQYLIAGGRDNSGNVLNAELFDPVQNKFLPAGTMNVGRYHHTATLLPNGNVLVAGGFDGAGSSASVEIYNPSTNAWTVSTSLQYPRESPEAALLANGNVLIAGGLGGGMHAEEIVPPAPPPACDPKFGCAPPSKNP